MKKITITGICFVLSITVLIFIFIIPQQSGNFINKKFSPFSTGTPDNPKARMEWELKRLVNPKTGKIPYNIRQRELSFAKRIPVRNQKVSAKTNTSSNNWISRGPYNIGGRTRALAMDINNENFLLAGGVSGGMWKSEDQGKTWNKTTDPSQLHSVTCIAQDTRSGKTNIWYYGTGEREGNSAGPWWEGNYYLGDGIFKSTDGGNSWTQLSSTTNNTPTKQETNSFDIIWNLIVDHTDTINDVVLVAVENGIYRSLNGGTDWVGVLGLDSTTSQDYANIIITPSGIFYATISKGKDKGFWRSENGVDWVKITPDDYPSTVERTVMDDAPSNENIIYFLSETPSSGKHGHNLWKYIYLKGDGADTNGIWENRSQNLPTYNCTGFFTFEFGNYSSQTSYDMYIKVKPGNENNVFLGGTNVYRSTDGFATDTNSAWIGGYYCDVENPSNYVYPNHHPDQHNLLFLPSNPDIMISSNDGGVAITYNNMAQNVEWVSLNNGYATTQFYAIAIEPGNTNSNIVIGGMQDNGTWLTNTTTSDFKWKNLLYGDGAYCAITEGRKYYYTSWQGGKTFKMLVSDSGDVTGFTKIDPTGTTNFSFINPFILDANDDKIMYLCSGARIWRNNNLEQIPITNDEYVSMDSNWVKLKESLASGTITSLNMPKGPTNRLYYGTSSGNVYRLDSANFGDHENVKITDTIIFPKNANVSCVAPFDSQENKVLVSFSNYEVKSIFYSEDAGVSWQSVSGNLEENPDGSGSGPSVNWVNVLQMGDSLIYFACTSTGVYSTNKLNGDSTIWVQEGNETIGNVVVHMIKTRSYDSLVVVGTHGNGIYSYSYQKQKSDTDTTAIVIPQSFSISAYPNPVASSSITINYDVPNSGNIEIKVYDLSGKYIAEIVNQYLSPKSYTYIWDGTTNTGSPVSNGIYFIRLLSGKDNAIIKVVWAK